MNAIVKIDDLNRVEFLSSFINAIVDNNLRHYASDLYPELELTDEPTFNKSLKRAQQVCATLNMPVHEHFKRVYRTSGNRIFCDYRLSHTAYLLVSINGDVGSKKVAQIQLELVKKILV